MANTSSAKKAIRSSAKKTIFNLRRKRALNDTKKNVLKAVEANDKKAAEKLLPEAYKAIDKAAKTYLHKKTAARYKARLASKVGALKK